jgi:hypothetical protein
MLPMKHWWSHGAKRTLPAMKEEWGGYKLWGYKWYHSQNTNEEIKALKVTVERMMQMAEREKQPKMKEITKRKRRAREEVIFL